MTGNGTRAGRSMQFLGVLLFWLGLMASPARLDAEVIVQHFTIDPTDPNWTQSLSVALYDPTTGGGLPLLEVAFVMQGTITGTLGVENLDPALAQSLVVSYSSALTLRTPGNAILAQVFPTYSSTQQLGVYDQTTDFGGASGATMAASAVAATTTITTSADDLARFTGSGTLSLSMSAEELLAISGQSGKRPSEWASNGGRAGVDLWLIYYTPEPSTVTLLGLGSVLGLGCCRRRRQVPSPRSAADRGLRAPCT